MKYPEHHIQLLVDTGKQLQALGLNIEWLKSGGFVAKPVPKAKRGVAKRRN